MISACHKKNVSWWVKSRHGRSLIRDKVQYTSQSVQWTFRFWCKSLTDGWLGACIAQLFWDVCIITNHLSHDGRDVLSVVNVLCRRNSPSVTLAPINRFNTQSNVSNYCQICCFTQNSNDLLNVNLLRWLQQLLRRVMLTQIQIDDVMVAITCRFQSNFSACVRAAAHCRRAAGVLCKSGAIDCR